MEFYARHAARTITAVLAATAPQAAVAAAPLAIELGVVRVKPLTLVQIISRLDDRFQLLIGGNRTAGQEPVTLVQ